ncbi:MAG: 4Fe-4S binding protein [Spirochaetales bacterium]|nr:4Fe-4S binding protein [Spirochaetales bacterium]
MNIAIVYISPNGTTKKVSNQLNYMLSCSNHRVQLFDLGLENYRDLNNVIDKINKFDLVGFGSPVYHMDVLPPIKKLLQHIKSISLAFNFRSFLFITYAGITSGKALYNSAKILNQKNIDIIGSLKLEAPHLHHRIKFPEQKTIEIIRDFCVRLDLVNNTSIHYRTYQVNKKIVSLLYPLTHFIGKRRELPIKVNTDLCKSCKLCIKECPVGAISLNLTITIEKGKCLHCYHCVIICPIKAIQSPIEKLDKMISLNKKIVGKSPLKTRFL